MTQERMEGWKEMAAHLGRSVRTIQRWERESGLPVRRLLVGGKPQVFAYRQELDGWRLSRESEPAKPHPGLLERLRAGWNDWFTRR
ncbi:hypothetical protein [Paludibaculum fermentans]|uniref:hypothetical protein n=1 Tax=Paludibaculum fermentans TaxID=1473598 RepID=UPI003EBA2253